MDCWTRWTAVGLLGLAGCAAPTAAQAPPRSARSAPLSGTATAGIFTTVAGLLSLGFGLAEATGNLCVRGGGREPCTATAPPDPGLGGAIAVAGGALLVTGLTLVAVGVRSSPAPDAPSTARADAPAPGWRDERPAEALLLK